MAGCNSQEPAEIPQNHSADTIVINGRIYTQTDDDRWVDALAIRNGKVSRLGTTAEITLLRGAQTRVYDLGGQFVMPGNIDAHVHPAWGGVKTLFQCNFPFTATPDEIAATVSRCVDEQPDAEWIEFQSSMAARLFVAASIAQLAPVYLMKSLLFIFAHSLSACRISPRNYA